MISFADVPTVSCAILLDGTVLQHRKKTQGRDLEFGVILGSEATRRDSG
jgi:hypothetical protein